MTGPSRSAHRWATLVGYSKGAKPSFSARRGLTKSMLRTIVQPDSMVTPCPDRFHTRCELFLIGLLEALPVCPMELLVFIDFLRQPRRSPRGASSPQARGGLGLAPGLPIARREARLLPRQPTAVRGGLGLASRAGPYLAGVQGCVPRGSPSSERLRICLPACL